MAPSSGTERVDGGARQAGLDRLEADGLLRREGDTYRTTRRWQAAMARAVFQMWRTDEPEQVIDLRLPIAGALVELYGDELSDQELAHLVLVLVPIEMHELDPLGDLTQVRSSDEPS